MAAGTATTYATTFTIAGKLLSSFTGAMTQAQSRMKAMRENGRDRQRVD